MFLLWAIVGIVLFLIIKKRLQEFIDCRKMSMSDVLECLYVSTVGFGILFCFICWIVAVFFPDYILGAIGVYLLAYGGFLCAAFYGLRGYEEKKK
ncbi:hypothetical protein P8884_21995 [Bacillus haynesii]|nr:hypothetical protein [Bacillus haynesii]